MTGSNETQRELEEIEQLITIQLQGIDKNFAECCELLDKIIVDVDAYGTHTNTVLDAFEVWQHFFSLFEGVKSYADPSIADTTSITNRPPLYDSTHSTSTGGRSTPWHRRKRSLEATPEPRMRLGKRGFTSTFLSDTSSSTNQTDPFYSPPQTLPFPLSQREMEGTPLNLQAKIITDNNIQALSMGFLDSDPSDELDPPQQDAPPRNIRKPYRDPRIFSPERSPNVVSQHSSAIMGFASPSNRSTRRTPLFKRSLFYSGSPAGNSNNGESSRTRNTNNNNNSNYNNNNNNNNSNNSNNRNNDNKWNDNILDKDNAEERERFNQFIEGRQRQSMNLDELPSFTRRIPSPTQTSNSGGTIPQPLIGSPTVLRVFDREREDLRRSMQSREYEGIVELNNEKERDEPMNLARETPERSTMARETFESPPVLRDDTPMRMTQELDRFSPMRIDNMEDVQHTPEAVPFFDQNLTYRPSPREETSQSSNDTTVSNITMIRGVSDTNIPAKFDLKYFPDTFRTPPTSTLLTRVFNLFSERPGEMLTMKNVLELINDERIGQDSTSILVDMLRRKKYLKPVGEDGLAWTIRR